MSNKSIHAYNNNVADKLGVTGEAINSTQRGLHVIPISNMLQGPVGTDWVDVDNTDPYISVFTFKSGGTGGTVLKTIQFTFEDTAKTIIASYGVI